jgi:hypothetical protein
MKRLLAALALPMALPPLPDAFDSRSCPQPGAVYVPHPRNVDARDRYSYELTITNMPDVMDSIYRFTVRDKFSGHPLSDVQLELGCGNGSAPCELFAPSDGWAYSHTGPVVELNRDLSLTTDAPGPSADNPNSTWSASYALVINGLDAFFDMRPTEGSWKPKDIRFFTSDRIPPHVHGGDLWVLKSCGPLAGAMPKS